MHHASYRTKIKTWGMLFFMAFIAYIYCRNKIYDIQYIT